MKISRDWLNNYIVSNKSNDELEDLFTKLGLECNIDKSELELSDKIIVGLIKDVKKHPNADRLNICEVDIAQKENLEIVCGAPNVIAGIKVPVATIGTQLGDFTIKKTKIRDIVSSGMICSEKELSLGENHDGIMILDSNCQIGQTISSLFPVSDTIFDFDMTPNRGDCFSHLGIARELAIIENKKISLTKPDFSKSQFKTQDLVSVTIDEPIICDRYSCIVIKNIKVGESPEWLKNKLKSIGQNSVNNIVDIANYVMFDLGQPLHTFDLNKIDGKEIVVRLAENNDIIECLDSANKKLSSSDIIISDSKGPIAIAGVIGGLNSHVDSNTTDILLESAIFNPINIRKTAKKHDYSKEASKRFERGVDFQSTLLALYKFITILQETVNCNVSSDFIDIKKENFQFKKIDFDYNKCNRFLGTNLIKSDFEDIFNKLSIIVEESNDIMICTIPSYRNDLQRDVDLYEEIARVYGYDNIPSNLNFIFSSNSFVPDDNILEDKIRLILANNSFNEHYSNSLYSEDYISLCDEAAVKIKNPLSKDMCYLRNSLMPGILKALSYNEKRASRFLKYFEIGSVNYYSKKTYNSSIEKRMLCIGYLGNEVKTWKTKKSFDIYDVKADITMLINNLGFNNVNYKEKETGQHEYEILIIADGIIIGNMYSLNQNFLNKFKFDNNVIICNIDILLLNNKLNKNKNKYKPVIPYPSIKRDIAILVPNDIKHEQIVSDIYKSSSGLLKEVSLFDVYLDDSFGNKTKSLAYSLEFQSSKKTLKFEDVDKEIILILKNLKNNLNAEQR